MQIVGAQPFFPLIPRIRRWHASVFLTDCYGLHPSESLVLNKGFDTGTHFKENNLLQQECEFLHVSVVLQPVYENSAMRRAYNLWLRQSVNGPVWFCRFKRIVKKYLPFVAKLYKQFTGKK